MLRYIAQNLLQFSFFISNLAISHFDFLTIYFRKSYIRYISEIRPIPVFILICWSLFIICICTRLAEGAILHVNCVFFSDSWIYKFVVRTYASYVHSRAFRGGCYRRYIDCKRILRINFSLDLFVSLRWLTDLLHTFSMDSHDRHWLSEDLSLFIVLDHLGRNIFFLHLIKSFYKLILFIGSSFSILIRSFQIVLWQLYWCSIIAHLIFFYL